MADLCDLFPQFILSMRFHRVSIGMELVNNARVLVLDEPTSGLDAYNARNLLKLLSEVARGSNRTSQCSQLGGCGGSARIVFASLHQPSPILFDMLDEVRLPHFSISI